MRRLECSIEKTSKALLVVHPCRIERNWLARSAQRWVDLLRLLGRRHSEVHIGRTAAPAESTPPRKRDSRQSEHGSEIRATRKMYSGERRRRISRAEAYQLLSCRVQAPIRPNQYDFVAKLASADVSNIRSHVAQEIRAQICGADARCSAAPSEFTVGSLPCGPPRCSIAAPACLRSRMCWATARQARRSRSTPTARRSSCSSRCVSTARCRPRWSPSQARGRPGATP
jgi:hypothetical protein